MTGRRRSTRFARASGYQIGAKTKRAYVCSNCDCWLEDKGQTCPDCGFFGKPIHFDSQSERRRYSQLRLKEKLGEIRDLELQPTYVLLAHHPIYPKKVCSYVADFRYQIVEGNQMVVEDVKGGAITDISALKMKHLEAQEGIKVKLVQA